MIWPHPAGPGRIKRFVGVTGALILLMAVDAWAEGDRRMRFHDVTSQTQITFKHDDGGSAGRKYIVESVSAGLALFDYDGDGDEDIYLLNGAPLTGGAKPDPQPRNELYRNDGQWRFTNVTDASGVGDTGYGLGVVVGDYDNDGDLDLYLNNFGPNVFYRNNGDGTFTDVTQRTGTANGAQVGAGAVFLDMDGDGDLDLYVASYVQFTIKTHVDAKVGNLLVQGGPRLYKPSADTLYRNEGDGTFTDVSVASGVAAHLGAGMGAIGCDFDDDGDTDIYVANDRGGNFLFQNDGKGNFEEIGLLAGVAFNQFGHEGGSMGVDAEDYDNDGRPDLSVTSYQGELSTLYRNLGDNVFEDVTRDSAAGSGSFVLVTWGNGLVDLDNDGDRDLFTVCGHAVDNIEQYDARFSSMQPNLLLQNDGRGSFTDVSQQGGDGLKVVLASRGAAFGDLDNDGDLDIVIQNARSGPTLLRNDTANAGHWLQLRLKGVKVNRFGVGARIRVTAGDLTQVAEVHAGRSYQSHYGLRLHFGLGEQKNVDRIEVKWIGGGVDVFENIAVDQSITLTEGSGGSTGEEADDE
jgi:hypothetical protein